MKQFKFILLFCLGSSALFAQENKKSPYIKRTSTEGSTTLASEGKITSLSLGIVQYWGLGYKKRNAKIGLGARLTSSLGNKNLLYQTAPAILTSGKTGPGVFFSPQIPANIDTLSVKSTQVNALNLYLALRYDFAKKWGVEFNIDMIGISFGGNKDVTLTYGEKSNATRNTSAKPTLLNALLVSDNDLGSLNSEFMISYQYNKKLKLKAGAVFLFNEYTIEKPVLYTNSLGTVVSTDRYRAKSLQAGIGLNYQLK